MIYFKSDHNKLILDKNHQKTYYCAGIDATRKGWMMVYTCPANSDNLFIKYAFESNLSKLLKKLLSHRGRIFIDMPVGLVSAKAKFNTYRECDKAAKRILGNRRSSVFHPPCYEALQKDNYKDASEKNQIITGKKISLQSWYIGKKITELHQFLLNHESLKENIFEAHPELGFLYLNDYQPLKYSKKKKDGIVERLQILRKHCTLAVDFWQKIKSDTNLKDNCADDDLVDALCLFILNQKRKGNPVNISDIKQQDEFGFQMGIYI